MEVRIGKNSTSDRELILLCFHGCLEADLIFIIAFLDKGRLG